MFLKLFKSNRLIAVFVLLIITLAAWLPGFSNSSIYTFSFDHFPGPLYKPIRIFATSNLLFSRIIAFSLYLILGFLLVRLNAKYFFIQVRTQLPAVIYLLIISGFVILQRFNPVIISSLLLIYVFNRLFETFKLEGLAYQYFDISFLISLSSLLYLNSILFMVFIWLGLILFRQFNWREWSFTLIGLLLPYLFIYVYYFVFNIDFGSFVAVLKNSLMTPYSIAEKINEIKIFMIVLGIIFVISSLFMIQTFDTKKTHARKFFLYFFWVFILTGLLFIFVPSFCMEALLIVAIPIAFLISHFFAFVKVNFITRLLFTLLILAVFYTVYLKQIHSLLK